MFGQDGCRACGSLLFFSSCRLHISYLYLSPQVSSSYPVPTFTYSHRGSASYLLTAIYDIDKKQSTVVYRSFLSSTVDFSLVVLVLLLLYPSNFLRP